MYVHDVYYDIQHTYNVHTCTMYVVLILSTKAVDHVNNMGNTCMMEPEPVFLQPFV